MKLVTIYALAHPNKPDDIRYVGKTDQPLHRRLSKHITDSKRAGRCYRTNWIKSVLDQGIQPVIWPIEICNSSNWISREKHWISFFKPLGRICNSHPGGLGGPTGGGWKWTQESKNKLSASRTGIKLKLSENGRATLVKIAISNFSKYHGIRGRKRTEESKRRMSQKMMGRKVPWVIRSDLNKSITLPLLKACNERKSKAVIAVETGQEFKSISEASRSLGCAPTQLSRAISSDRKFHDLHWKLKERELII